MSCVDQELVTKPPSPKTDAERQLMIEAGHRQQIRQRADTKENEMLRRLLRLPQALKQNDNLMSVAACLILPSKSPYPVSLV